MGAGSGMLAVMPPNRLTNADRAKGTTVSRERLKARTKKLKDQYLDAYHATGNQKRAAVLVNRAMTTVDNWKQKDPEFAQACRELRDKMNKETLEERRLVQMSFHERTGLLVDDDEVPVEVLEYDEGSFEEFRLLWLKTDTPKHQQLAVRLWQDCPLGNIIMMLWPPEHGKTTLAEDYLTYQVVHNENFRCTVGSEKQGLARRIIGRVRNRLEYDGPTAEMVRQLGPFSPNDPRAKGNVRTKVWGADQWNQIAKQQGDERDYTAVALGIGSQIAGTRTDQLLVDDVTSLRNYRQTHTDGGLIETFRQDWLSRPGEWGRTAVNGTRVGTDDFYEELERVMPADILTIVRQPAITFDADLNRYVPLWPERYDMTQLERMRAKVGEEAWARNYMQQPSAKQESSFPAEVTDPCKDPTISVIHHDIDPHNGFILTVDPSIGGVNVISVIEYTSMWMMPVWIDRTVGLTQYDAIFARIDNLLARYMANGAMCRSVIFEDKHFQSGMMTDSRVESLQKRYGFAIEGHKTGYEKSDPDIGIPAIPTTMRRGEFIIPWADDDTTQHMMGDFVRELERWRPFKKGVDLEQDQVVTIYFAHQWWQRMRSTAAHERKARPIRVQGLPYEPTGAGGMLLPSGFRG